MGIDALLGAIYATVIMPVMGHGNISRHVVVGLHPARDVHRDRFHIWWRQFLAQNVDSSRSVWVSQKFFLIFMNVH